MEDNVKAKFEDMMVIEICDETIIERISYFANNYTMTERDVSKCIEIFNSLKILCKKLIGYYSAIVSEPAKYGVNAEQDYNSLLYFDRKLKVLNKEMSILVYITEDNDRELLQYYWEKACYQKYKSEKE